MANREVVGFARQVRLVPWQLEQSLAESLSVGRRSSKASCHTLRGIPKGVCSLARCQPPEKRLRIVRHTLVELGFRKTGEELLLPNIILSFCLQKGGGFSAEVYTILIVPCLKRGGGQIGEGRGI